MTNLQQTAKEIRKTIYKIAHYAGGGHMGASFSMADIISVLYFDNVLRYDASNPEWEDRDKFILSKGHACYALYAVLARAGYFPEEELIYMDLPYTVEKEGGIYVVEGPKIEKMLGYTNLDSEKGFAFFQKFLKDTGILDELESAGIQEGDTVRMYGLQFDYYK